MTRILALFALLLGLATAACGAQPVARTATGSGPALWEVTDPRSGATGWLFGTVHALPGGVEWERPVVADALVAADRLVLEVAELDDRAALGRSFTALGASIGEPDIADRVAPELRDEALDLVRRSGVPREDFRSLDSWAAALTLASAASGAAGLSSAHGVEAALIGRARVQGLAIEGLETPDEQFRAFDGLNESDQRAMLDSIVAEAGDAEAQFAALLDAWLAGNVDAIARLSGKGLLERPAIRTALLERRNADWTDRIAAMLASGAQPFVAVGAAHLAGPDSVAAMLAARGLTVRRIA